MEAGVGWPAPCRSTPELDQLRAQYSAFMPYPIAAGVLEHEIKRFPDRHFRHAGYGKANTGTQFSAGCILGIPRWGGCLNSDFRHDACIT
jgi:hypothetical protein